jgi:hypothetical protein
MFARSGVIAILATPLVVGSGQAALAQTAWVADGGSLSLSLDYAYSSSNKVLDEFETEARPVVPIQSHTVSLSVEYAPIDRVGVELTVPVVASRFSGDPAEAGFPRHGRYDDGHFHTTLTDTRLIVRYMLGGERLAVSPYVGIVHPLTEYETVGYAGAGRHLRQVPIGFAIGTFFGGPFERLFVHGTYEFVLSERYRTDFEETGAVGQNRSDASLLAGYAFTDRLQANVAANLRLAHGGIAFEDARKSESPVLYTFHDPLLAEWFLLAGGGLSYQFTPSLRVDLLLRLFVLGEMTRNAHSLGGGMSWDVL